MSTQKTTVHDEAHLTSEAKRSTMSEQTTASPQDNAVTPTQESMTAVLSCDSGWLTLGNGCYMLTPGATRKPWDEAEVSLPKFDLIQISVFAFTLPYLILYQLIMK